jgi:hypothetical protein
MRHVEGLVAKISCRFKSFLVHFHFKDSRRSGVNLFSLHGDLNFPLSTVIVCENGSGVRSASKLFTD